MFLQVSASQEFVDQLCSMKLGRRASSFLDSNGPTSAEELGAWDVRYVQKVLTQQHAPTLLQNMMRGVLATSDFSGYDAPRESCRIITEALRQEVQFPVKDVQFVRACDNGPSQKRCLKLQSSIFDSCSACVFSDFRDRLPSTYRDWVDCASPTKEMSIEDCQQANAVLETFISKHQADMFPVDATCYCEMHRRRCPVFPGHVVEKRHSRPEAGHVVESCARDNAFSSSPSKGKSVIPEIPWHEDVEKYNGEVAMPIIVSISGLVCTDWSRLGLRKGSLGAGLTQPVHRLWQAERVQLCANHVEDWYFTENSDCYPVQEKQTLMFEDTHEVKAITTCPTLNGYPMRRPRMYSFGFDKSRWVWTGASSAQEEFDELFHAICQLPGDVYLQANAEEVASFVQKEAAKRKQILPAGYEDMAMRRYLTCLLPPGGLVRLGEYESFRSDRGDMQGNFMADLQQNMGFGCTPGPEVPSLNTHPCIYSWGRQRLALGQELLQAQGIDFYPVLSGKRKLSPLVQVFQDFDDHTLRMFAGNGIHTPSFGAWFLYCASRVISRSEHSRMAPTMPSTAPTPEDDDEPVPSPKAKAQRVCVDLTDPGIVQLDME